MKAGGYDPSAPTSGANWQGQALASEKLAERDGIQVSKEIVRQIMLDEGWNRPKHKQPAPIHPPRERRPRRGELIQIHGS
jgi:hypothetical protein